ncbi:hypothetical protein LCGC14_1705420 [marine sediment metagenome]|uniref:Uncharacterized protein n=1 Tax=marine sediment metagenome TaxID=412755 RepID=A0A0F9JXA5_9ZZZZ
MRPRQVKEIRTALFPAQTACMRVTSPSRYVPDMVKYKHQYQGHTAPRRCRRCGESEQV